MTSNDVKRAIERAAEFRRVSDESQTSAVHSALRDQHRDIGEMAEREGWTIVAEYEEPGVSGALELSERAEIQRLMADARQGAFDVVVFWDNKRMGRNSREVVDLADDLRKLGILVAFTNPYAVADYYDDNDQLLFMLNSHMSERDLRYMKALHARGRYGSAKEGRWPGGTPAFGYELEPKTKRLLVHEGEAVVVKRMFELVASGVSAAKTAEVVNREFAHLRKPDPETGESVLPKRLGGRGWGSQSVIDAIRRKVYFGGGVDVNVRPHPDKPKETITLPAPAIVEEDVWRKANEAHSNRKRVLTPASEFKVHSYAFPSRVAHVHPDGSEFAAHGVSRQRKTKTESWLDRSYRCSASVPRRGQFGPDDPNRCEGFGNAVRGQRRMSISADMTEALFLKEMLGKLKDRDTWEEWMRFEDARLVSDATRANLTAQTPEELLAEADVALAELKASEERWIEQYGEGIISKSKRDEKLADIGRRAALLAEVKVRAADDVNRGQMREATIESLFEGKVGGAFHPGQEREAFWVTARQEAQRKLDAGDVEGAKDAIAEGDYEVVEAPAWSDVSVWLVEQAEKVISREVRELHPGAIDWAARLVEVFDVRLKIHDVGMDMPRIVAPGFVTLSGAGADTKSRKASEWLPFALVLQGEDEAAA